MRRINRRDALKTGAAFVLAFRAGAVPTAEEWRPNAWIRITPDDRITLLCEVPELGQGPRTAEIMLLAEELEAEWNSIRVEQAPVVPSMYPHLGTGGSGATRLAWDYMRQAGAQAREMLVTAAAQKWSAKRTECRAERGSVKHIPSGRRFRYGELVAAASKLPPVDPAKVALKRPSEFRLIGRAVARTDVPAKVDGSAQFGLDVRVAGMQYAVIERCPHFGGKLQSFDASAAKLVPGVRAVFAVEPIALTRVGRGVINIHVAGGVAVVADSTWAAIQGRKALKVVWEKSPGEGESTAALREAVVRRADAPATVTVTSHGDVTGAFNRGRTIEARYELPFQAHATMEPMNTTVHVRADGIEVWSPTQIGQGAQKLIASLAGIPLEQVTVHMMLCGGSFGRRYQWDYLAEAWEVAREMTAPVQLVWTREDDMRHGFYRPYSYHKLVAALDESDSVTAWSHRIVSTPIRAVFDSPESLKDPAHVASQETDGADEIPYAVPNITVDYAPVDSVVPRAWWRSVAASFNTFAVECFIDELAHAAGADPLEFRLRHLRPEMIRLRNVAQLAAEKSGWGVRLGKGEGRGIACYTGFGSYICHVAEVSVSDSGKVLVKRIVSAVDCGTAVNPDGVLAMLEGAVNFALTPVLTGEITVNEGAVKESNFHEYSVLRISQSPDIEVYLIPSDLPPEGMGEPGVPPLAPAVCNAIFAASGKRFRRLPLADG